MKMYLHSAWLSLLAALAANGHFLDFHAPAAKRGEDAGTSDPNCIEKAACRFIVDGTDDAD